jgi:hypothetical protein
MLAASSSKGGLWTPHSNPGTSRSDSAFNQPTYTVRPSCASEIPILPLTHILRILRRCLCDVEQVLTRYSGLILTARIAGDLKLSQVTFRWVWFEFHGISWIAWSVFQIVHQLCTPLGAFCFFFRILTYGVRYRTSRNNCTRAWSVLKDLWRYPFYTIAPTKIVHLAEISILAECWSKAQELRQHVGSQSQLGIAFNENELGQRIYRWVCD